jgi:zinc/manganese transport system substrate-binding protein
MKQRLIIIFAAVAIAQLFAAAAQAELRVVTTTTDLGDLARRIGGDAAHVETICRGTQDPHTVQARPSYMVKLSRADLLIAVGLELEVAWLPALIQGSRNPDINPGHPGYLEASEAVRPIDVPTGRIDRSRGDIHPLGNPHYWLDPENTKRVVRLIAERMAELDPEHASGFRTRAHRVNASIHRGIRRWRRQMAPYRGTLVASYHATFNYFLRRYGLRSIGYLEPRPGVPPSPSHLARLIRRMRSRHVPAVLHEGYYDRGTSEMVSRRAGAALVVLPTSVGGAPGTRTYEQLMDHLVERIVAAAETP